MTGIVMWCLSVFLVALPAQAKMVDGIAAIVNGDIITYYELNQALNAYVAGLPKTMPAEEREKVIYEARIGLLNRMIDETILTQEAARAGISVKEEEITANIQDFLKKRKITLDKFKELLQQEGASYEKYRKDMKEHFMKMRLAAREISSKISVSDDEIGEYYGKNRDVYEGKETVKIRQILFPIPKETSAAIRQKVKESAEALVSKLKAGQSFDEVMQESEAMGADTQAGADLGFIEKGIMMPEVDEVAFKLKPGEYSSVIVSPAGFHIIQVVDRRGAGVKSLQLVREEIKDELLRDKSEKKMQEWLQELRKKSYVDIKMK